MGIYCLYSLWLPTLRRFDLQTQTSTANATFKLWTRVLLMCDAWCTRSLTSGTYMTPSFVHLFPNFVLLIKRILSVPYVCTETDAIRKSQRRKTLLKIRGNAVMRRQLNVLCFILGSGSLYSFVWALDNWIWGLEPWTLDLGIFGLRVGLRTRGFWALDCDLLLLLPTHIAGWESFLNLTSECSKWD